MGVSAVLKISGDRPTEGTYVLLFPESSKQTLINWIFDDILKEMQPDPKDHIIPIEQYEDLRQESLALL